MYEPRLFKYHSLLNVDGIQLKFYSISAKGNENIDNDLAIANVQKSLVMSEVPTMEHFKAGYVVHHAGEDSTWLLTRVWLEGGIVSGLLHRQQEDKFEKVTMPLIECVWESVVTQHERDAWVSHMMSKGDREGYLGDYLKDGYY